MKSLIVIKHHILIKMKEANKILNMREDARIPILIRKIISNQANNKVLLTEVFKYMNIKN